MNSYNRHKKADDANISKKRELQLISEESGELPGIWDEERYPMRFQMSSRYLGVYSVLVYSQ
jgi:hypothetical protein